MPEIKVDEEASRRLALENEYGADNVFDSTQLRENFEVEGFGGGICVVKRRSDGVRGSLDFDHMPRFYYRFIPV
jgi:hypothetical protein